MTIPPEIPDHREPSPFFQSDFTSRELPAISLRTFRDTSYRVFCSGVSRARISSDSFAKIAVS